MADQRKNEKEVVEKHMMMMRGLKRIDAQDHS